MLIDILGLSMLFLLLYFPLILFGEGHTLASDVRGLLHRSTVPALGSDKNFRSRSVLALRAVGLTAAIVMYVLYAYIMLQLVV